MLSRVGTTGTETEGTRAGWRANPTSCPMRQELGNNAGNTVLADSSQKKSMCSDAEHEADTRDGLAGL